MIGFPDVRSCCGCCPVEVGAKIIASLQLIAGVLFLCLNMETLIYVYLMENIDRAVVHLHMASRLAIGIYPILQGTLLWLGIKKKKAVCLLVWLYLAFICEIFIPTSLELYVAVMYTIFTGHFYYGAAIILLGGIHIGISFFCMVIVSTCRKNILRRNAQFDYGAVYTPDAVEILTPKQRTGLSATNPQFDYVTLDSPEVKQEVVVVT